MSRLVQRLRMAAGLRPGGAASLRYEVAERLESLRTPRDIVIKPPRRLVFDDAKTERRMTA
ncbi:MAG: hypothetical protein ACM3NQ_01825 [Bacteroidales bacterium]